MEEMTFVLIKPNAMKKQVAGAIIQKFQSQNLKIKGIKMMKVSQELCKTFYQEHEDKPFFQQLIQFISSDPVIVLVLSGDQAVRSVREIMGDTDPTKAKPGTIRFEYGDSLSENAVHGSDSLKSAKRELALFFDSKDLF